MEEMKQKKIEVTYFFRKPRPQYHSIERVFGLIMENLPDNIVPKIHKLSGGEKGYFTRCKAILEVRKNKGQINHITGDISYVALGLPRKGLVITFHDLESLERSNQFVSHILKWFWVKLPAQRASVITVISEHTKKQVMEWAKVPESKIQVIPNPLPKDSNITLKKHFLYHR
jgi:glycosyltransferase involved in cell wall biosynthesis